MMPFYTQKHAQRLEQAGFTRRQAEVVTRATQEIVAQNLVTRSWHKIWSQGKSCARLSAV